MRTLPTLVPKEKDLFAGGRGPACWQREFSRVTAKQDNLQRACAWVAETVQPASLRLQTAPLWGTCLTTLVHTPPQETPTDNQPKPAKRKNAMPPNLDKKPTINAADKRKPAQTEAVAAALACPPKAQRALLQQLAKPVGKIKTTAKPADKRPVEKTVTADTPTAVSKQQSLQKADTQAWRRSIANKASNRIAQADQFGHTETVLAASWQTPAFGSRKQVDPASSMPIQHNAVQNSLDDKQTTAHTSHAFVSAVESAQRPLRHNPDNAFTAAWQQQLTGQSVPTASLTTLSKQAPQTTANYAAEKLAGDKGADPERVSGSNATDSQTLPSNTTLNAQRPLPTKQSAGLINPTVQPLENSQQAAFAAWDTLKNREPGIRSSEPQVAPPQMANTLPALKAAQTPATRELPLATAVARHSARTEAATAPETLDDLAAKIKQILDEESRRFGIAV